MYKELAKSFLSARVQNFRNSTKKTQQEMADELRITPRAYGDLERGKYCFSATSLIFFFLLLTEEESRSLLADFSSKVHEMEDESNA